MINENSIQDPLNVTHLFIQNQKINQISERVHRAATGKKHSVQAIDNVVGVDSAELRDKILSKVLNNPRKTEEIGSILRFLTQVAVNMRADDGLTNGACNVVKSTQLNARSQPSSIIWVQFYQLDVGEKKQVSK